MIDTGEAIRKLALNVARLSGLAPLARPLVGGVGAILMLHRVTSAVDRPEGVNRHLAITPQFLDAVIADMKASGYQFVTMDEVVERLRRGTGGPQFATITADDGYRDNLTEALPILERHGAPITIYVAPRLTDRSTFLWWVVIDDLVEKVESLSVPKAKGDIVVDCSTPAQKLAANTFLHNHLVTAVDEECRHGFIADLAARYGVDPYAPSVATLMDWDEIRTVSKSPLVTIGAHSVSHLNLKRLSEDAARREIAAAPAIIAEQTGLMPRHMAYPYGYAQAVGGREVELAGEAGFASAVTTRHGVLRAEHADHLHALPRISLNGRYQRLEHLRTMLTGVTTPLANAGKMVVTV